MGRPPLTSVSEKATELSLCGRKSSERKISVRVYLSSARLFKQGAGATDCTPSGNQCTNAVCIIPSENHLRRVRLFLYHFHTHAHSHRHTQNLPFVPNQAFCTNLVARSRTRVMLPAQLTQHVSTVKNLKPTAARLNRSRLLHRGRRSDVVGNLW